MSDEEVSEGSIDRPAGYETAGAGSRSLLASLAYGADRQLLQRMLQGLGNPPVQLTLWDGRQVAGASKRSTVARVLIRDRAALWKLAADPELQFGDLYAAGRLEVEGNLVSFLEAVYRAQPRTLRPNGGASWLSRPVDRNSVLHARDNIHHHYDIGNSFYRLWLDRDMVYTCAYYSGQAMDLEQAQRAKLDYVCRKLRLKRGDRVVEAGCGWGALALHMAKAYGAEVKAYNISREQVAFARERAQAEGIGDRVEFVEADYRDIRGKFDAFVSVGMLEHVGPAHYRALGEVIERCLAEGGRGLIHSIGRDYPDRMNPWIERRIFPAAHPPSLSEMMEIFEPSRLSVLDVENLRLHYAKTLEHWLERFDAADDRIERMFDREFVRTWRLYLAGSLAAFRAGDLQLFQVSFARAGCNGIPWTRHGLYGTDGGADGNL